MGVIKQVACGAGATGEHPQWDSRGAEDAAGKGVVLDLLAIDEHHGLRNKAKASGAGLVLHMMYILLEQMSRNTGACPLR